MLCVSKFLYPKKLKLWSISGKNDNGTPAKICVIVTYPLSKKIPKMSQIAIKNKEVVIKYEFPFNIHHPRLPLLVSIQQVSHLNL